MLQQLLTEDLPEIGADMPLCSMESLQQLQRGMCPMQQGATEYGNDCADQQAAAAVGGSSAGQWQASNGVGVSSSTRQQQQVAGVGCGNASRDVGGSGNKDRAAFGGAGTGISPMDVGGGVVMPYMGVPPAQQGLTRGLTATALGNGLTGGFTSGAAEYREFDASISLKLGMRLDLVEADGDGNCDARIPDA